MTVTGTTLGLLLSAFAQGGSGGGAGALAVIPQIILAGVIAPLSETAEWFAIGLVTVHWGESLQESCLPETEPQMRGRETGQDYQSLVVLGGHILLFVVVTLLALIRPGHRRG